MYAHKDFLIFIPLNWATMPLVVVLLLFVSIKVTGVHCSLSLTFLCQFAVQGKVNQMNSVAEATSVESNPLEVISPSFEGDPPEIEEDGDFRENNIDGTEI